jgi:choline monooxygenase
VATDPELSKAETLPASWYHDPDVHERERRAVWGREWLVLGRSEQLRRPGDYIAGDLAGWSVFAMVGDDGEVRAFHNVCPHRAGPLVWDEAGRCGNLVCRYHGWAFTFEGGLRRARDFGDAADFDEAAYGLTAVRVESWRGLVFVNLDPDAPSLVDSLGGFAVLAADYPMEEFRFSHEVVHELRANWKTYADNYLEGYHVPLVHPELNREIDARRYEVEVGDRWCIHRAPARDGAVNSGRWLWRHPNLALNLYPDGMNVERWYPAGPGRTRLVYQYFFRDLDGDAAAANAEVVRVSTDITAEDVRICEAVQRNLEGGVYDRGRLSPRHENAVFAFQRWVRDAVESPTR